MMKKILPLLVLVVLLMPMVVFAQPCGGANQPPCSALGYTDENGVGNHQYGQAGITTETLTQSILGLVNWFSWFVGLVAVVMGLYSGFLFITARDNANQITTARQTMMYAIIGIAVAIISFSLVAISKGIFNF